MRDILKQVDDMLDKIYTMNSALYAYKVKHMTKEELEREFHDMSIDGMGWEFEYLYERYGLDGIRDRLIDQNDVRLYEELHS